jgi:hypothetical protein
MSLISKVRRQPALWFRRSGVDVYGSPTFDQPVEIVCRWDDTTENIVAADGEQRASRAIVMVDRLVSVGDLLLLVETITLHDTELNYLQYFSGNDQAWAMRTNRGCGEVIKVEVTPNMRNTESLIRAYI